VQAGLFNNLCFDLFGLGQRYFLLASLDFYLSQTTNASTARSSRGLGKNNLRLNQSNLAAADPLSDCSDSDQLATTVYELHPIAFFTF